jgi:transcriptional regulator with GAF, ATPase, and Fis domain
VGELAPPAQVRLLRVLQDGTFERVGGQRAFRVDVRIVAATHRDLRAMLADGRFREDLWYRISVFPIDLPPLREHAEDVPALATHFALRAAARFGTPPIAPSPEDLELLVAYPWPGNVRELISVVERAVILGDGRALAVGPALGSGAARAAGGPAHEGGELASLASAIARHIEEALVRAGGRVEGPGGAADLLDVNPHTLRARMRKLGIDWSRFRAASRARAS